MSNRQTEETVSRNNAGPAEAVVARWIRVVAARIQAARRSSVSAHPP